MSDAHLPPVASGDLTRTPFAHLVLYLYQRRSSGTLVLRLNTAEHRVLFHRGRAVAARVPQPAAALDDSLIELTGVAAGPFDFYETDLVGSGATVVTGMFDPFAFVLRAARSHSRVETVDSVLSKYAGVALTLDNATDWNRLSLSREEQQLVTALRQAPSPTEALCAQLSMSRDAARRLLYGLMIIRAVLPESPSDSANESGLSGSVPAARPSPAPRVSRPVGSRGSGDAWRAIASAAAAMAEGRPPSDPSFRPPRNSSPNVQRSVTPPARVVTRPLTQPGFDTPSRPISRPLSQPLSQPLPGRPRDNSRPLSQPLPGRSGDSRPLMPGAQRDSATGGLPRARGSTPTPRGTPRPSQPDVETLDAAGKFRRVEQLCQRNAYNDALPIIRALLETDRKNAKYLGMLAHVLLGRINDSNFGKELVDSVNQALRLDSDQVYALYTKARCYKRLGKEREALHYFRRTVAVDPNHLDAAREARLLVSRLTERKKK
ncbi:MAG TPA: hypothetical protein VFN67_05920 [Polyangiales bacterium]|nr:hypothetical protein [Polyangiales bacterium]